MGSIHHANARTTTRIRQEIRGLSRNYRSVERKIIIKSQNCFIPEACGPRHGQEKR